MIRKFVCNTEKLGTACMATEMSKYSLKKVFAENVSLTLETPVNAKSPHRIKRVAQYAQS